MDKTEFGLRLAQLRQIRGLSSRDMSYALGKGHGYINNIECGVSYPAMEQFFAICEILEIEPVDFFDLTLADPSKMKRATSEFHDLTPGQLDILISTAREMKK